MQEFRIERTLLAEPPRPNSLLVALTATSLLWLVSAYAWNRGPHIAEILAADATKIRDLGEAWRLITAVAVHADGSHLLANSLLFCFLAYLLYGYFGFWVFPVATTLLGGATNWIALWTYLPQPVRLVGASGAVYWMAGFWITMYILVERHYPLRRRLVRCIGVFLLVLLPTTVEPTVSYRTHWIGLALGVGFAIAYFLAFRDRIRQAEVVVPIWTEIEERV